MISKLFIDRDSAGGKYADVIDVCEHLGNERYGSATNAAAQLIRQAPEFAEAQKAVHRRKKASKAPAST